MSGILKTKRLCVLKHMKGTSAVWSGCPMWMWWKIRVDAAFPGLHFTKLSSKNIQHQRTGVFSSAVMQTTSPRERAATSVSVEGFGHILGTITKVGKGLVPLIKWFSLSNKLTPLSSALREAECDLGGLRCSFSLSLGAVSSDLTEALEWVGAA